VQVDGSSVVDDSDVMIITSESDDDASLSPARNTSDVTVTATGVEIPDVWDGFDEGCADAFIYEQNVVVSPPTVSEHSLCCHIYNS